MKVLVLENMLQFLALSRPHVGIHKIYQILANCLDPDNTAGRVQEANAITAPNVVLGHVLEHEVSWLQHEEAMGLTANLSMSLCSSLEEFRDLQLRHLVLRTQALGPGYIF